mgnify:CR=1 FL=1|tara:strand:+ start:770 stop:1165 length:396 start_codon:yes stop_codon:yes gene_type:complete
MATEQKKVVQFPVNANGRFEFPVNERVALLSLMPKQGNYLMIKQLRVLSEALSFSDSELKLLKPEQVGESLRVSVEGAANIKPKAIDIPEPILSLVRANLRGLNQKDALHTDYFDVYEKLMPEEDKQESAG